MGEELNVLIQNATWHLVPYHVNMNLLSYKWVYEIKYNFDASLSAGRPSLLRF